MVERSDTTGSDPIKKLLPTPAGVVDEAKTKPRFNFASRCPTTGYIRQRVLWNSQKIRTESNGPTDLQSVAPQNFGVTKHKCSLAERSMIAFEKPGHQMLPLGEPQLSPGGSRFPIPDR